VCKSASSCADEAVNKPTGARAGVKAVARTDMTGDPLHPEWNYTIRLRHPQKP
jgi:hypothetical protein